MKKDKNTGAGFNNDDIVQAQEIKSRKLKYGTLATVFTIVFIVAVIIVNVFVGYLTDRFVLEFDMTAESLFEISESTREVLADLTEPITITVLSTESNYKDTYADIYEILQRYGALGGNLVTVEFVNPDVNPLLQEKYSTLGGIAKNDIIIESSKRFKHLTPTNLYEYQSDDDGSYYIVGLRAEQRLTSGILFTLQDVIPMALFTEGHGETTSLSQLEGLLTSGNYEVGTVNLAMADIPEDTGLLILSSPTSDFSSEEIEKLDAFLTGGGDAIVAMSTALTTTLTNLERYFEEWGVRYNLNMVFDTQGSLSGYPMYIVPTVNYVEGLTDSLNSKLYITIPGARSITTLFESSSWRTTQALMTTTNYSYAKDTTSGTITMADKEAGDEVGPFDVAVLATEMHADNLEYTYSHILFCNTGMIGDTALATDNLLNSSYIVATLNVMTEVEDTVIINAKTYESTTLAILGSQVSALFWILIIIIPFGILAVGIVIWFRRRHL